MRFATAAELLDAENLEILEGIDEISLIAAPGITDKKVQEILIDHCEKTKSRFAILDPPEMVRDSDVIEDNIRVVRNSDHAVIYFPRIQVMDFAAELMRPELEKPELAREVHDGEIWIGPSGHIAGVYARVDHERGVHKAPDNEVLRGALNVEFHVTKAIQDRLIPRGVNCLRFINGSLRVWGARTVGGDANIDLNYINVRRTLIFLEESIVGDAMGGVRAQ